jgi:hypothetical protein
MNIKVKNSQLNNETIQSLNTLIELDINASAAFKLTRIIKELSSIVDDKIKLEKRILDKWIEKDEAGNPVKPVDAEGKSVDGAVNITNVDSFTQEMNDLMNTENEVSYEKLKFEDLNLTTVKVKDLMKLEFLFD